MGSIGILTNILAVRSSSHAVDVKTGCTVLKALKTTGCFTNPLGIFGSGVGILTQIFAVGCTGHAINVQTGCAILDTIILCATTGIATGIAAGAASSVPNSKVGVTLAVTAIGFCQHNGVSVPGRTQAKACSSPSIHMVGKGDGLVLANRSLRATGTENLTESLRSINRRCIITHGGINVVRATIGGYTTAILTCRT